MIACLIVFFISAYLPLSNTISDLFIDLYDLHHIMTNVPQTFLPHSAPRNRSERRSLHSPKNSNVHATIPAGLAICWLVMTVSKADCRGSTSRTYRSRNLILSSSARQSGRATRPCRFDPSWRGTHNCRSVLHYSLLMADTPLPKTMRRAIGLRPKKILIL
jgi:hypothetical protein